MRFSKILEKLSDVLISWRIQADPEIFDIEIDSTKVKEGDLFICRKGEKFDSHNVAAEVVKKGARALICEREVSLPNVSMAVVSDSRVAEAILSDVIYNSPHNKLLTIGVTGTNGKTTVVHMLHYILRKMGLVGGMISTVYNDIVGNIEKTPNTTPNSLYLFRVMDKIVKSSGKYVVFEVSSHAISMKRIYSIAFDAAALLNVTRDHLDFHGDFEAYKNTKYRIFEYMKPEGIGIINGDFIGDFKSKPFRKVFVGSTGDYKIQDIKVTFEGTSFILVTPYATKKVNLRVIGKFNAYNAAFTIAILTELGFAVDEVIEILQEFPGVEGRFERAKEAENAGYKVFVDFAHTPDALKKVLETARSLVEDKGRVIIVFGAGGHADRGKREIMGKIAYELADISIVTDDDPRGEDPEEIISDILKGYPPDDKPLVLRDRREAIETAVTLASKKDIVIIAGRGHEDFQVYSDDKVIPFKDIEIVNGIFKKRNIRKR